LGTRLRGLYAVPGAVPLGKPKIVAPPVPARLAFRQFGAPIAAGEGIVGLLSADLDRLASSDGIFPDNDRIA
jgi:hypothetical protein